jgi:hypothetical protein
MKPWQPLVSSVACIAAVVIASCTPSLDLTRSRAKAIIESTKEFTEPVPAELFLDLDEIERGIKFGYWTKAGDPDFGQVLQLSPSGHKIFASSMGYIAGGGGERPDVITRAKTRRQIRGVTDITEAPGSAGKGVSKIVEFLWSWNLEQLPKEVHDFAGAHAESSFHNAIFDRHPDGWHLKAFDPEFRAEQVSTAKARQ